ncbi:FRG domain-containing protein [Kribbella sp. NPDC003557]|uniref:FRG domain-containing protein n=1 Tax=Kribbella sp. NPDC003557 TaxID=3154449 RepID=UPI0033BEC4A7
MQRGEGSVRHLGRTSMLWLNNRLKAPPVNGPWIGPEYLANVDRRRPDAVSVIDGVPVLTVDELPSLVQAVGYLKFHTEGLTYLRGQTHLYDSMLPSLFRGARPGNQRAAQIARLVATTSPWTCSHSGHKAGDCIERLSGAGHNEIRLLSGGVPRYAAEPLLQHYGVKTRWIDVVDNLWIALWFACHSFGGVEGYRHPVRRTLHDGGDPYVYVITVGLPGARKTVAPGLVRVPDRGRIVDLREAVPSFYLRPHAQHGLLVRPHDDDYFNLRLGALRIPLPDALDWLGSSLLLSPFALFPPPSVDVGYRRMIRASAHVPAREAVGQIDIYGPGY